MRSKDDKPRAKTAPKKASSVQRRKRSAKVLPIIKNDPWLEPYADAINGRHQDAERKRKELGGKLVDFANAHHYFGLQRNADGSWTFREWAPHATSITLIGDFSRWNEEAMFALKPVGNGVWEINLPANAIHHGDYYKMMVRWTWGRKINFGDGWACGALVSWRCNGPPRRRCVGVLRGRSPTLVLRHGPDSYGRQQ